MHSFNYSRPTTLAEATALYADAQDPVYLSGGQTLIPTLRQRLAAPSELIDLSGISELDGISMSDGALTVGALTRHATVAESTEVRSSIPALAGLAAQIGDAQVRNCGRIGGSIANSDPAADYPAAVVGLGATVHTNERRIAGEDFFVDLFETALEEGEIVTAIEFPIPIRAAYRKFPNPASRYAVVGVMVAEFGVPVSSNPGAGAAVAAGGGTASAGGGVATSSRASAGTGMAREPLSSNTTVRVGVTGAGPCAFRAHAIEEALNNDFSPAALDGVSVASERFNSDLHASAEYRAHLVGVMAKRAVADLLELS